MARVVGLGVGIGLVVVLFVIYLASAPPLLVRWEAGATTPTLAAGWYDWPQWLSALIVAVTSGLTYLAATRLGASPVWAGSASLASGLGWTMWMLALVPSAKSVALLLVGVGIVVAVWWDRHARSARPTGMTYNLALLVAILCFVAGAWMQSLLPVRAAVRMSTSVPDLVRLVTEELRPLGLILAAAGAVQLCSRAWRATLLLGVVLAVYLLLVLVGDVSPEAVLLPASLLLWIAVAFGLQWIALFGARRSMFALALVLAVLLPGERLLLNRTFVLRAASPFFPGSLAISLAAIGAEATLLSDGPATDRRIGRAAAVLPVHPFRVVSSERWSRDDGSTNVFAFQTIRGELETAGRGVRSVSRRVPLSAFLRALPEDNIVAIALTPFTTNVLSREAPAYFSGIGAADTTNAALASALIGRARSTSGALVQQDREATRIGVTIGTPWGDPVRPSPIGVDVAADRNVATIAVEGREILRVPHGGALVVTSPEGLLQMAMAISPEQRLQMPLPADEWSITQLVPTNAQGAPLPDPLFAHPLEASAVLRFDGRDRAYFTSGWHLPERNGTIDFMWTSEAQSRLQLPLMQPLELRVIVELRPAVPDERDPPLVRLHVNGLALDQKAALPGRRMYEWHVPETAWRAGANDVALELTKLTHPLGSHDQRLLGAAVSLVRLERVTR